MTDIIYTPMTPGTQQPGVQQLRSLQGPPDLKNIPKLPEAKWPEYMLKNAEVGKDEVANIEGLLNLQRSVNEGYFQSHPYDQMHLGADMKLDELAHSNTYMKLVFGGKPDPKKDNIDLAYNHSIRQMAESPVEKDSILGYQDPLMFVPGAECDKDAILKTFEEQRRFYKGAIDTDTERFLKARTTHNLTTTTYYGKKISQFGSNSVGTSERYNHVRGQNDLLNRPHPGPDFRPDGNLSSKTFAPNGEGGEVPLNYENVYGLDPRAISITTEPRVDVPEVMQQQWNANDLGSYFGQDTDRYLFNFADQGDPSFINLFHQFKPRQ